MNSRTLDKSKPVYLSTVEVVEEVEKLPSKLSAQGYTVYDLKGGVLNWKANNFQIVKE